jgi:Flp pilus assembly protein TadB
MENLPGTKRKRRRIWWSLLLVLAVLFLTGALLPPRGPWLDIVQLVVAVLWCAVVLLNDLRPRPGSRWSTLEALLFLAFLVIFTVPSFVHFILTDSMTRTILLATIALCGLISLFALARRRFA